MSNEINNRYFEWLVGEKQGEILLFDHIEDDDENVYICFKDKSRINEALVANINQTDVTNKMMAEIENPTNVWKFKDEYVGRQEEKWELNAAQEKVCVQPFVAGRKVVHLIPPRRSAPKTSNFGTVVQTTPPPPQVIKATQLDSNINETDPVYILMSKSKKVNCDIQMNLTIALPPKSLYNIAKESFDEGSSKVIEYIVKNISISEITEAIKKALGDMYEEKNEMNNNG